MPAQQPPTAAEIEQEAEPKEQCLLGSFCFGPVLTLGVFNPLGIGIHGRIVEQFGFGIDYQFLPSISVGDASAGMSLFTLMGRWHPGGSSFFLGLGFAYQSFYAEGSTTMMSFDAMGNMTSMPVKAEGSVDIPMIAFGLGVMGGDGFVMGIDLSLEVPLGSASVTIDSTAPPVDSTDPLERMAQEETRASYDRLVTDIEDAGDTFVNLIPVLFQLNLIRIGYIF